MTIRFFALSCLLLLLIGCTPFAPHPLTVVSQPQAEAWTRPLSNDPLRQTFILPYNQSVNEIEVVLAIPENAPTLPSRPLTWKVTSANNAVLREGVIETAGYLHNTPIRMTFDTLPAGESIDLAITAPAEAQLSLWRSAEDRYPQGTLIDESSSFSFDLLFTLRAQETPATLYTALEGEIGEWQRAAQWLPLLLFPFGWMLLWLLGNGEGRPRAAATVGLSLALIPILYLWASIIHLQLYLPLVRSLFSIAAALTLFIVIRRWRWLWAGWQAIPIGAMTLLAFGILLNIATWLMAGRDYLAPPGIAMVDSGLLAQAITDNGVVVLPAPPLPPAALTSILSTISQVDTGTLLIFIGFVLAVAALPALFTFVEEITEDSEVAVWLLPLAWLWQGTWDALASGDWFALYSYALMPVAFAMGLRALRVQHSVRRALFLAAVPLATLFLVQGVAALLTWFLTVGTAIFLIVVRRQGSAPPSDPNFAPGSEQTERAPINIQNLLPRTLVWLLIAMTLLAPTLIQRLPVIAPPSHSLEALGYGYLLVALVLALILRGVRRWLKVTIYPAYLLIALLLLALSWWRSAPLPPTALSLQADEAGLLTWMSGRNTPTTAQSLINLEIRDGELTPVDGGFWSPVFNRRATVYTLPMDDPSLLTRALQPGALEDALLRDELRQAGITHVLLGGSRTPLKPTDLQSQTWARLAYQSGGAYLFELVSSDPTAQ